MRTPFAWRLMALAAVGLLCNLLYALAVMRHVPVHGDGLEFHALAAQLAAGQGYIEPLALAPGHVATADKPPLYPLLLAGPALVGAGSILWNRVVTCVLGAVLVITLGLLGRRVGGERTGMFAALLGAVYPLFVVFDGSVRSEALYAPLVALALLAAYRLRERPGLPRAAVLGGLVGLAALTRSEGVLLLALAAVAPPRGRLRALGVATLACAVVLSPWLVRNWITFGRPVLSTNLGSLIYGANCQTTYYGRLTGSWACFPSLRASRSLNEVQLADRLTRSGARYARRHDSRIPAVMAVRLLRTWDLWSPRASARLEALFDDSNLRVEKAGIVVFYLTAALAAGGALALRRRGEPLAILLLPLLLVSVTSIVAYGTSRFRVAADVALVVLAGVALARSADRLLHHKATPARS